MFSKSLAGLAFVAALFTAPALADDGHDHDESPAASTGSVLPRFAAVSQLFELVGVVNGKQLTVYVDRFDDNAPAKGAQVELAIGGTKVALEERADGEFEGALANELAEGVAPVTATIVAGGETVVLSADLDVHAQAHDAAAEGRSLKVYAAWGAALAAALAALALLRRRASTPANAGGAA